MYAHNVISFHRDEKITPAECLEIGETFADRFFPDHQSLVGVHQDKDHLHCHIVTNSVSYINGKKLHQSKLDLERQKQYTNTLCRERGLSVAEKGRHFNGTQIEDGEIRSWNKDKYNLLIDKAKDSYVADCALAVLEVTPKSTSREEFIQHMSERGWTVQWKDNRKHIVFMDQKGRKVRDSNLARTFSMDVGKEALYGEFKRAAADKEHRSRNIRTAVTRADAAIEDAGIAVLALAAMKGELSETQKLNQTLIAENQQLERENAALRSEHATQECRLMEAEQTIRDLEDEIDKLRDEVDIGCIEAVRRARMEMLIMRNGAERKVARQRQEHEAEIQKLSADCRRQIDAVREEMVISKVRNRIAEGILLLLVVILASILCI